MKPIKKKRPFWQDMTPEQMMIGGSLLSVVIIVLVMVFMYTRNNRTYNVNIGGVEAITGLERGHVEGDVTYDQTPPVGGLHNAVWQNCGVYDEPIANIHAVHSLEHGVVWITYQPSLDEDEIDKLADITRRGTHRLLSPYPGIDSPIIVSAWGFQLKLEKADDQRLLDFIQKYEQGPTTPELGASCSGGQSRTLAQLQLGSGS